MITGDHANLRAAQPGEVKGGEGHHEGCQGDSDGDPISHSDLLGLRFWVTAAWGQANRAAAEIDCAVASGAVLQGYGNGVAT
jgi:hypothetical protein